MGTTQQIRSLASTEVIGSGMRVRRYPTGAAGLSAVGVTLTSDGAAYVYPGAVNYNNVKAFVVANTVGANWRYYGIEPFVPSNAGATEHFILLGAGTAGAVALTKTSALLEVVVGSITAAVGGFGIQIFPYAPTVIADGVNDAAIGCMCTTNAVADTLTCAALLATGLE